MPPETISHLNNEEFATLPALRAQTGLQSKASKLPPLIPTYASKVALTGYQVDLPQWDLHKRCTSPLKVLTTNAPTVLPKGSKLLHISPSMLPESCLQGGAFVSEQHLQQPDIDRIVNACGTQAYVKAGPTETQLWGVPWTEEQFAKQMVEFGHPASLKSGLPAVLNDTICRYSSMDVHERMAYRASRLGYWLRMLVSLKEDEAALKQQIDSEVLKVIGQKNVLLWKAMLKSVDYPDQQVMMSLWKEQIWLDALRGQVYGRPDSSQPASVLMSFATLPQWSGMAYMTSFNEVAQMNFQRQFGQRPWKKYSQELSRDQSLLLTLLLMSR